MPPEFPEKLTTAIDVYVKHAREELDARWKSWSIDLTQSEVHEVIGGLLARQVTLATQIVRNPSIWNEHVVPVLLRCMADNFITLAWILKDPVARSRLFILYGLGQEKLFLEHQKAAAVERGDDPEKDPLIKAIEAWINSQQFTFLTEVNVGSWSGTDTRKMAEEAGCLDFYRYVYGPFSAATHSMWNHVAKYNLIICTNPLHGLHRVPIDPELQCAVNYLYLAAKYLRKAFDAFDVATSVKVNVPSAFDTLTDFLQQVSKDNRPDVAGAGRGGTV